LTRVLVTGSSTGIGRAAALRLATAGALTWAGVRDDASIEELKRLGPEQLRPLIIDVTDQPSIDAARDLIRDAGGLDVLVNNAGIGIAGPLELLTSDELREQLEVNFIGQIAVTRSMLPLLRASQRPRIVFVSSVAGRVAFPFAGAYSAAKHALEAAADSLRNELSEEGFTVSLVEPDSISTPIWAKAERRMAELGSRDAAGRYGRRLETFAGVLRDQDRDGRDPEEVAEAVEHAALSEKPSPRYPIGWPARVVTRVRGLIPDRLFDLVARRPLES
jgi:NAD(P)-dependent dehydrogenase (short-subunit alcohol dehydrogenase family)